MPLQQPCPVVQHVWFAPLPQTAALLLQAVQVPPTSASLGAQQVSAGVPAPVRTVQLAQVVAVEAQLPAVQHGAAGPQE
jgi:hypothetical protein